MKTTLQIVLLLSFFNIAFSQDRKGQFYLESGSDSHEFYIAFKPYFFDNQDVNGVLGQNEEWKDIVFENNLSLTKGIDIPEEKIVSMEESALRISGNADAVKKLRYIFKVQTPNNSNEQLFELARKLETLDFVDYCALVSSNPIKPPYDIPPVTPNFEPNQTYIGPNPGLNMQYAWNMNLAGAGIRVRNVEYGFNKNHEDLHQVNCFVAPGMTINSNATNDYVEHGTPVFGVIMADKGNYGISGLAHEAAEMILFPEWQQTGYNRIYAVAQSIANSQQGDVIIYEMQTGGQNDEYVPAEYNNTIWDLTKAASDSGVVIVAAAGNGNQNLDTSFYAPYMNRGNSGAIIVGAGWANTTHNRISYSTYGARVDVQGWGNNVYACGYGDVVMIGGDFNQAYTNFSGTSSATPLVAACVIVLQSYHHQLTGNWLTGSELREILQVTGIPQGNPGSGNIGPFPNMQAAIELVYDNYVMSVPDAELSGISFEIYPNPVRDEIRFLMPAEIGSGTQYEIFNTLGQQISKGALSSDSLQLNYLESGMYFIRLTYDGKSGVRKFVKN